MIHSPLVTRASNNRECHVGSPAMSYFTSTKLADDWSPTGGGIKGCPAAIKGPWLGSHFRISHRPRVVNEPSNQIEHSNAEGQAKDSR